MDHIVKCLRFLLIFIFSIYVTAQDTETSLKSGNISDAEILIGFQQMYAHDQNRLNSLQNRQRQLDIDFQEASGQFNLVDSQVSESRNNQDATNEVEDYVQQWELFRARLDFLLQRRQSIDQQLNILNRKIGTKQKLIDIVILGQSPSLSETQQDTLNNNQAQNRSRLDTFITRPLYQYDSKVAVAARELGRRETELRVIEQKAQLMKQLISLNGDDLALVKNMESSSRKQLNLLGENVNQSGQETTQQVIENELADPAQEFTDFIGKLLSDTRNMLQHDSALVVSLEKRIANLEKIQQPIIEELDNAESLVSSAQRKFDFLKSPLAPHQIKNWFLNSLPRLSLVIVFLILLWIGARWLSRKIISSISRGESEVERVERVETLRRVTHSGITIVFVIVGVLVVLSEFGVDLTVVLGGAAVLSLAIAFGAQNLVRDYFTGFMILMENQYRVGNVIKIDDKAGLVEDISLRMTVLRDLEGIAHFIPHGQISSVSNLTHGWSRVVLDIGVAYKEDVDRVIEVLIELAKGMQEDPEFGELIISDPEILGVDAFEASSVTIKLLIQTLPLKQWLVKREFLRRTKNRFDELDIEIPFPHRTIYHRNAMDIVSQLTHRDSSGDEQKPEEKEVEEKEYQN